MGVVGGTDVCWFVRRDAAAYPLPACTLINKRKERSISWIEARKARADGDAWHVVDLIKPSIYLHESITRTIMPHFDAPPPFFFFWIDVDACVSVFLGARGAKESDER